MSANAEVNVKIPSELRNILLELVVAYLMDQPPEFLDFAIDFLKNKKDEKLGIRPQEREIESEDSIEGYIPDMRERRNTICAERYDPEEDTDYKPPVYRKDTKERLKIIEAMKNIIIFRSLDNWQKEQLLEAMMTREVFEGEELIKQGDEGDFFYIVDTGVYESWLDGRVLLKKYDNSGSFGELALMYNVPRSCTVKATSDGVVWTLDRQTFRRIVVSNAFKKRKVYETLVNSVPLLAALNETERLALADALVSQSFQNGQKIITQGDIADGMYFIEKGTVSITVKGRDRAEVEISKLGVGEYFGELALLTNKPRAASAWAEGNVRLAFLDVDAFERLLGPCIEIMKRNFDLYEEQLNTLFGNSTVDLNEIRK